MNTEGWDIVEQAAELARRGEEFALATVVWRQAPSSGQIGARAIITREGQLYGFIGGACAEPVVLREAVRVIRAASHGCCSWGRPTCPSAGLPEGMLVHPHVVPERGRHADLCRTRRTRARPRGRRRLPDDPDPGRAGGSPRLEEQGHRARRVLRRRRHRALHRRGRHAGSRRRGRHPARGLRRPGLRRPGRLAQARAGGARLPRRARRAAAPARPGPDAGRARPRPHQPPGDRGRGARRARAAPRGRRAVRAP